MPDDGTTTYKFALVLNKKVPIGRVLNAAGHLMVALVERADAATRLRMHVVDYLDRDGVAHPTSGLPLVVLQAKNANQIRAARAAAIAAGLPYADFTASMTGGTYVEQMERTAQLRDEEIEYWGLAVFGDKPAVDAVCGRFSLWRDAADPSAPFSEAVATANR